MQKFVRDLLLVGSVLGVLGCQKTDDSNDDPSTVTVTSTCGDGERDAGKECDDGNLDNGDGCSSACLAEDGYACGDDVCQLTCGDGNLDPLEACDDGNLDAGDGCDPSCQLEVEEADIPTPAECNGDACQSVCGNDDVEAGEECDDGNTAAGDGCSAGCRVEIGWACGNDGCTFLCGNDSIEAGEECDDGNTAAGDGCSAICRLEAGWSCNNDGCAATCGNGSIDLGEECDDSNTAAGDGCSASCRIEAGYSCTGEPSTCQTTCGDGITAGSEECDDGNSVETDACPSGPGGTCMAATCGDGFIERGIEECDDKNTTSLDGCSDSCQLEPDYSCSSAPSTCTCQPGYEDDDTDGVCRPTCATLDCDGQDRDCDDSGAFDVCGSCKTGFHDGGDGTCVAIGTCSLGYYLNTGTCTAVGSACGGDEIVNGDFRVGTDGPITDLAGCVEITGSLWINGTSINTVDPLVDLERIGGDFSFVANSSVSGLSPLAKLENVGGNVNIQNNGLFDVTLSGLVGVGGDFRIEGEPNLSNIDLSLEQVNGLLSIRNNADLNSLALRDLLIVGSVHISDLPFLFGMDLSALELIQQDATIENIPFLGSLNFSNVASVGGNLTLRQNETLGTVNLFSLERISGTFRVEGNNHAGFGGMRISTNLLSIGSDLVVRQNFLDQLTSSNLSQILGDVEWSENSMDTSGGSSLQFDSDPKIFGNLTVTDNQGFWEISGLTGSDSEIWGDVLFRNNSLPAINIEITNSLAQSVTIDNSVNFGTIALTAASFGVRGTSVGNVVIENNTDLFSLTVQTQTVRGDFRLDNNSGTYAPTIDGDNGTIGGDFVITDNAGITGVNATGMAIDLDGDFTVTDNPNYSCTDATNLAASFSSIDGTTTITGNSGGC